MASLQVAMAHLAPQARRCLQCVLRGLSNKETAAEMGLSQGTIKVYLSRAFHDLGVAGRNEFLARRIWELETELAARGAGALGAD